MAKQKKGLNLVKFEAFVRCGFNVLCGFKEYTRLHQKLPHFDDTFPLFD